MPWGLSTGEGQWVCRVRKNCGGGRVGVWELREAETGSVCPKEGLGTGGEVLGEPREMTGGPIVI